MKYYKSVTIEFSWHLKGHQNQTTWASELTNFITGEHGNRQQELRETWACELRIEDLAKLKAYILINL